MKQLSIGAQAIWILALLLILANNIILYITFLHAYFFNNYIFIASINKFGEAHLELVLLTIIIFLGIYVVGWIIKTTTHKTIIPEVREWDSED